MQSNAFRLRNKLNAFKGLILSVHFLKNKQPSKQQIFESHPTFIISFPITLNIGLRLNSNLIILSTKQIAFKQSTADDCLLNILEIFFLFIL